MKRSRVVPSVVTLADVSTLDDPSSEAARRFRNVPNIIASSTEASTISSRDPTHLTRSGSNVPSRLSRSTVDSDATIDDADGNLQAVDRRAQQLEEPFTYTLDPSRDWRPGDQFVNGRHSRPVGAVMAPVEYENGYWDGRAMLRGTRWRDEAHQDSGVNRYQMLNVSDRFPRADDHTQHPMQRPNQLPFAHAPVIVQPHEYYEDPITGQRRVQELGDEHIPAHLGWQPSYRLRTYRMPNSRVLQGQWYHDRWSLGGKTSTQVPANYHVGFNSLGESEDRM